MQNISFNKHPPRCRKHPCVNCIRKCCPGFRKECPIKKDYEYTIMFCSACGKKLKRGTPVLCKGKILLCEGCVDTIEGATLTKF